MDNSINDMQEKKILEIRTEFNEYRKYADGKFDEILDKLKPMFTTSQITTFLISLVGITASIVIYASAIKSDARNNTTEIQTLKVSLEKKDLQYEVIMSKLNEIDKKVDINAVKIK